MRARYVIICVWIIAGMATAAPAYAQHFSQPNMVGQWYSCNSKKLYYPGDTIKMNTASNITIQALFDTCKADTNYVELWRYTPKNELISEVRYIDRKNLKPTEQKVLYYPCTVSPADSTLLIPTRRFMKVYKVLSFDKKQFKMVFSEVVRMEEEGTDPSKKP